MMVLLLACLNVANVMLVRATVRQREMAIRAALGSGRRRLISQLLTESMLLAFLGAVIGLGIGKLLSTALASTIDIGTDIPYHLDFSFDWRVFANALLAAVATGIVIGIWPALRAAATAPGAVLHDGGRGSAGPGRQRVRSILVICQVAGSLVLLITAGLFTRSLNSARQIDIGFNPDHILNARIDTWQAGYTPERSLEFFRELKRRLQAIPGVQSVSVAFSIPVGYIGFSEAVYPHDKPVAPGEQPELIGTNRVDENYFANLQIPIVSGRAFTEHDNADAPPVAIVNQTLAARLWPGRNPIGQRLRISRSDGPIVEIIGVARNSKYIAVYESPLPYIYVPIAQMPISMRTMQLRSFEPAATLRTRVIQEIRALDPDMPVSDVQPMAATLSGLGGFLLFRIGALQAGAMGVLGLVLAVIGVYGVVSYGASQRTREIGIRMALGAQPLHILAMILRQGIVLVVLGVVVGLGAAAFLSRVTSRIIVLVSATDPGTFAAVTLLLAFIALLACYIPARRATRINPTEALRHE
jgi:predicted permease